MKHVPNALSISRIILSFLLLVPFIVRSPLIYIALYLIIGMTDVLDGPLARRFKVASELGAKLDSFGDIVFFLCIFVSLLVPPRMPFAMFNSIVTISFALAFKLFVIMLTRIKFKVWNGIMHTYLDKTVGFLQFFTIPVFFLMGEINYWILFAISTGLCLSAVEEAYILLTSSEYDPNHPGVLVKKWLNRSKENDEAYADLSSK
ncbi:MAG: CDP-alcohol phosphatidyltransferase family protein [Oscillospiraceae bacterium]|nr:CDP-alcohol phosphatidyltransferase family protein [Oscillospiraceae bacterium]